MYVCMYVRVQSLKATRVLSCQGPEHLKPPSHRPLTYRRAVPGLPESCCVALEQPTTPSKLDYSPPHVIIEYEREQVYLSIACSTFSGQWNGVLSIVNIVIPSNCASATAGTSGGPLCMPHSGARISDRPLCKWIPECSTAV